jgi:uncharacterized RmlC-like cupin family protein
MESGIKPRLVVVHPDERVNDYEHGFRRAWGVLGSTTGSRAISMAIGRLSPGSKAAAHKHPYETAILILSGRARVHYGEELEGSVDIAAGDFLYIPADLAHSPETFGDEPMRYVVARAAADETAETWSPAADAQAVSPATCVG